jgi:hypothetical protein
MNPEPFNASVVSKKASIWDKTEDLADSSVKDLASRASKGPTGGKYIDGVVIELMLFSYK